MDAPAAPVLTEQTAPGPGVEVYWDEIDEDAETITVWRQADGMLEKVRTAAGVTVVGDFQVIDWEVPFGVPVSYFCDITAADGSTVRSAASVIQVDRDLVHLSNPMDPSQVYVVPMMQLGSRSFGELARPRDRQLVFVAGVPRPFAQDWGPGALSQMPMSITTDNASQAQAFHELLAAPQVLIRTPPVPWSIVPRLLYASVAAPTAIPRDWIADGGSVLWQIVVDEVQPIAKSIMRPLITYDDWIAAFPKEEYDYDAVMAFYQNGSWTDVKRNPFGA